jgi:hypothetical protein
MGTATSDIPPIVLIVSTHDGAQQYDAVVSRHGDWVANAASEPEALECAHDLQPDAVIVDICLGGAIDEQRAPRAASAGRTGWRVAYRLNRASVPDGCPYLSSRQPTPTSG